MAGLSDLETRIIIFLNEKGATTPQRIWRTFYAKGLNIGIDEIKVALENLAKDDPENAEMDYEGFPIPRNRVSAYKTKTGVVLYRFCGSDALAALCELRAIEEDGEREKGGRK